MLLIMVLYWIMLCLFLLILGQYGRYFSILLNIAEPGIVVVLQSVLLVCVIVGLFSMCGAQCTYVRY